MSDPTPTDHTLAAPLRPHSDDPRDTGAWRRCADVPPRRVFVRDIPVSNLDPLVLFGGVNVLDHLEINLQVAERLSQVCARLSIPFVFKASFDKANRSSYLSDRGPGLEEGLRQLEQLKIRFDFPLLTDIHEPWQAAPVSEVVDLLQLPAFLCRQTDLLDAACQTGLPLHIKKMQSMAPQEMEYVLKKCEALGNDQVILCERGTSFGYHHLIVDMLSFPVMKRWGAPLSFDVTHALQQPGSLSGQTGGRGHLTDSLAFAGITQGIAALFLECHPEPLTARCDGACALRLEEVDHLLERAVQLDEWIKSFESEQRTNIHRSQG